MAGLGAVPFVIESSGLLPQLDDTPPISSGFVDADPPFPTPNEEGFSCCTLS